MVTYQSQCQWGWGVEGMQKDQQEQEWLHLPKSSAQVRAAGVSFFSRHNAPKGSKGRMAQLPHTPPGPWPSSFAGYYHTRGFVEVLWLG